MLSFEDWVVRALRTYDRVGVDAGHRGFCAPSTPAAIATSASR
jgi:hypothetical protein